VHIEESHSDIYAPTIQASKLFHYFVNLPFLCSRLKVDYRECTDVLFL